MVLVDYNGDGCGVFIGWCDCCEIGEMFVVCFDVFCV